MRYIQLWIWGLTVAGTDLINQYPGDEPNPGWSTWSSVSVVFWERWKMLFWWRRVAAECWSDGRRCWNSCSESVRSDGWRVFPGGLVFTGRWWSAPRWTGSGWVSRVFDRQLRLYSAFGLRVRHRPLSADRWVRDRP
jgi:hypothetical protein